MVVWQHDSRSARQVREFLTVHCRANRIHVSRTGFGHRVHPHVEADVVSFHWVIGHALFTRKGFPSFDKAFVGFAFSRLEIVPGCQMANKVRCVEARKLFFTNRESNNRNVVCRNTSSRQFFVKADVRITVDRGNHANLLAVFAQCDNVCNNRGPVRVTEGCVVYEDVVGRDAFSFKIGFKDVVGCPWVDIVGAQKREFLNTQLIKEVVRGRDRLLVGGGTGVEHVLRAFFTFVLNRIEQQAVQLFDNRQNRFPRNRCPIAEDHVHIMNRQKLACFFSKERPVRRRVNNNCFYLAIQYTTGGVLLFDQHQHRVF